MKSNAEPELYKSIVAYDGTDYLGFQRQSDAERTVQGELEAGLRRIGWKGSALRAAGRTDAGVHARGQVIAYRMAWRHGVEQLNTALNAALPRDLAVSATELAPEGFDPRFSATGRRYCYRLITASQPDPFAERYAWRIWPSPDEGRLTELAALFVGRRDFAGFGRPPIADGHSVREIHRAEWARAGRELAFTIEADAFLYRMVRRVVGSMIQITTGGEREARLRAALEDPTQFWSGRIAPARGLTLEAVQYEERRDRLAENILSES